MPEGKPVWKGCGEVVKVIWLGVEAVAQMVVLGCDRRVVGRVPVQV